MIGNLEVRTNQDLYQFIVNLCEKYKEQERSLRDYLFVLWSLSKTKQHLHDLSVPEFLYLIEHALTEEAPFIHVQEPSEDGIEPASGFQFFEQMIVAQILDLDFMNQDGTLQNEYRFFGVQCSRVQKNSLERTTIWYNFDPLPFLECAVAGAFDGWTKDPHSSRELVSGKVAFFEPEEPMKLINPENMEDSIFMVTKISWEDFANFLEAGQSYE